MKKNVLIKPDGPHFPNPYLKHKSNISFIKGKNEIKIFIYWYDIKGMKFQSKKCYHEQVEKAYENYFNESMGGSTSYQESMLKVSKSKEL